MIEFDPDRVPPFKMGLHLAQVFLAFVLWVMEIVVFTGKDAQVVGNNGWTFAAVSAAQLRGGKQVLTGVSSFSFRFRFGSISS